ncbi:50S ribosomal protein L24 [Empedobacter sp. UBA7494]|uniref:50S ribosomal protein L24 n=1 Tax=Empedobacter sp. UBA7494 TaxID=1946450 RepID=UPI0025C32316|nr:50S ribosomal protein L24 [Empedobacter sp. UBA7494]
MAKLKIKKGDKVVVLSGSNKGQTGTVLRVFPDKAKAIVEGVNIAKKRVKPSAQNPQGGVVEKEAQIYLCKLALVDPETGKATKVAIKEEGGKKVRITKKSGKAI